MEPFLEAFFSVDESQNEIITLQELEKYVRVNNLDKNMITQWRRLFDPSNTGRITLSKFCEVLGLKEQDARIFRNKQQPQQTVSPFGPDVTIILAHMSMDHQLDIVKEARRLAQPPDSFNEREVSQRLKTYLDRTYKRMWHVVILKGSFWCTYSHDPDYSFHFRLNKHVYLVWRNNDES